MPKLFVSLGTPMRGSQVAYDLIKDFEKLRLRSYPDSGGKYTIGYGSTKGVHKGMIITEAEAVGLLIEDVYEAEQELNKLLHVLLLQHQYDALLSWLFNLGNNEETRTSALLRRVNAKDPKAGVEFMKWVKGRVNGKLVIQHGLTRRRITERRLFETGILSIEP